MPSWKISKRGPFRVIEWCGLSFAVWIMSHRRSNIIGRNPLLPVANVFVHVSEVATYRRNLAKFHPDAVILPHRKDNFVAITQFGIDKLFDNTGLDFIFRVDDEFVGFLDLMTGGRYYEVSELEQVLGVIVQDAVLALEAGSLAWGYNLSGNPRARSTLLPLRLRGWFKGNGFGLTGHVSFPAGMTMIDDLWLSLKSLQETGLCLVDQRHFVNEKEARHGPHMTSSANRAQFVADVERINMYFGGEYVKLSSDEMTAQGLPRIQVVIP